LLNPGNDLLHLRLPNFGKIVVVPGLESFNSAVNLLLLNDLFKTFVSDGAISRELKQEFKVLLKTIAGLIA
jgi:hypothetical protein